MTAASKGPSSSTGPRRRPWSTTSRDHPVLDGDAVPFEQCSTVPSGGETALVLLLHTDDGVRELHGYFNNCVESGYYDGTRRYALTSDTCHAPFAAPPLRLNMFEQSLFPVCGPA